MDKAKIDEVIRYFRIHRYETEHKQDFDKAAQSFKISRDGRSTLLAKISNEVLDDTQAEDVARLLDRVELCERLERLKDTDRGLLVTSKGVEEFTR